MERAVQDLIKIVGSRKLLQYSLGFYSNLYLKLES
jgi:hypothetical protein